ncbi:uncharacterized protein [Pseudochaenichthys georgianus]|uniref:uncharacterized protein isoform X1 n=1 Tax=Pseudochaenichthys georgianus TaxID=52239 RepID=UPI00146BE9DF|nr:uncharacterized protein si:ch211-214p13.7 isoform X1 [Pseudochaenichthys georgianus]
MGNCTSGKKKRKGDTAADGRNSTDSKESHLTLCIISRQPKEEVLYASIDHTTAKGPSRTIATADDDCDYATVFVPAPPQPDRVSQCSSKDECADDYVLMG